MKNPLFVLILFLFSGCVDSDRVNRLLASERVDQVTGPNTISESLPLDPSDHSIAYWRNGWRQYTEDLNPDLLCFESGHFGFTLNVDQITRPGFKRFDQGWGLLQSLDAGSSRIDTLDPAELDIQLETDGTVYRLVRCKAATLNHEKKLESVRMWEAGIFMQHYDVLDLTFEDQEGNLLGCYGELDLVAWPKSLTFNLKLKPEYNYKDGPSEGVVGNGWCTMDEPYDIPHREEIDPEVFTIETWVKFPKRFGNSGTSWGWLLCKNRNEWVEGNIGIMTGRHGPVAMMNIGGTGGDQVSIPMNRGFKKHDWNHLVMTYDGTEMKAYLNGLLQGTKEIGKPRIPGRDPLRLGQRGDGLYAMKWAIFDQVRMWNRALSANEILAHSVTPSELSSEEGLMLNETFDPPGAENIGEPLWKNAIVRMAFTTADNRWETEKTVAGDWVRGEEQTVSLNCDLPGSSPKVEGVSIGITRKHGVTGEVQSFPVVYDEKINSLTSVIKDVERKEGFGLDAARDYDEFFFDVENTTGETQRIPFLLNIRDGHGISGQAPLFCDENGVPTGIPVQLSKNWHHGAYRKPTVIIPAEPGKSRYMMRIVYGFYGTIPSASVGQLSLVGWGGNGRWDQAAVGTWGETICLDTDMSLVDCVVADVRALMLRKGLDGKIWAWSDAGWGADWFSGYTDAGDKMFFNGLKTAYLSHGPCLTDIIYDGYYGPSREVDLRARFQLSRVDDYCRNFFDLSYTFEKPVSAIKSSFFRMGRNQGAKINRIAYGNRDGVLGELVVEKELKTGDFVADQIHLTGEGPWWVGFPDGKPNTHDDGWGTGSRALIIRSFKANIGGETFRNPILSLPVIHVQADGQKCVDAFVVPDQKITSFHPGDTVTLDVEFISLPRIADDYFGPNTSFLEHLTEHPESWKTYHREAVGNDLVVNVDGGRLLKSYPVLIEALQEEITIRITGGVGLAPLRFEGLESKDFALYEMVDGQTIPLDQSVFGNDFWQTDYDAYTDTYKMSFNIPLDGKSESTWVLTKPRP